MRRVAVLQPDAQLGERQRSKRQSGRSDTRTGLATTYEVLQVWWSVLQAPVRYYTSERVYYAEMICAPSRASSAALRAMPQR